MDSCSHPSLTPLDEALIQILNQIKTLNVTTQRLTIDKALGRILAEDVASPFDIPHADNSAMDGYAMKAKDSANSLTVIATVYAGHPFSGEVGEGECVRIMTGGEIPKGADAVIMQENAEQQDNHVHFTQLAKPAENIRPKGEDIAKGACVLKNGHRLTPADLGLLATLGLTHVSVFQPIKVAVISTGDELQLPGASLAPGQFYESNGFTSSALLERFGADVINMGIVRDDLEQLRDAFRKADELADVVITSGGVSVGEADYSKQVVEELGQIDFWKVAIKPGKPFAFGRLPSSYFIGLPGNPVSSMVTLHQLGLPILRKLQGEQVKPNIRIKAKTTKPLRKRPGRTDFQRGIYHTDESGQVWVQATGGQGSGLLTSMSQANCYIVLEQDRGHVEKDEEVLIEPFDGLIA